MNAVIGTTDLADELGVTPETVSRWIREGKLPSAFRRRGRWRIPIDDAQAFAEEYARERAPFVPLSPDEEYGAEEDDEEPSTDGRCEQNPGQEHDTRMIYEVKELHDAAASGELESDEALARIGSVLYGQKSER